MDHRSPANCAPEPPNASRNYPLLTVEKAKITVPLLLSALFYDLSPDKTVKISSQSERRERDLQELFRRAKKPVALFIDDAQDLHAKMLTALKRLMELVAEGGGQFSVVLVGKLRQKNGTPPVGAALNDLAEAVT